MAECPECKKEIGRKALMKFTGLLPKDCPNCGTGLLLSYRWGLWYGLVTLSVASLVYYAAEPFVGEKLAAGLFLVASFVVAYYTLPHTPLKKAGTRT